MKKKFILLLFLCWLPSIAGQQSACQDVLDKMFKSIRNIKTVKYDLKIVERINGKPLEAASSVKLNLKPRKIYLQNKRGIEILWVENENKGLAYVHPNSFPYVTLNLDPYGDLMRKDQHHTIQELGFEFIGTTIANFVLKEADFLERHFRLIGSTTWNGIDCYQLYFTYPEYTYDTYTVLKKETVRSIAKKLNVGEYKIREKNPRLTDFDKVKEGGKLTVPTCYASKILLLVSKSSYLPLNIKIYDDQGLYESYEYSNVKVNCTFAANEFTKEFTGYKF